MLSWLNTRYANFKFYKILIKTQLDPKLPINQLFKMEINLDVIQSFLYLPLL